MVSVLWVNLDWQGSVLKPFKKNKTVIYLCLFSERLHFRCLCKSLQVDVWLQKCSQLSFQTVSLRDGPDVYTSNPSLFGNPLSTGWYPRIELDEQDRLVENKQTESEWRGAICEEVADRIIYGIKHLLPPAPGATSVPISPNTFVWKTSLKLFEAEQTKHCSTVRWISVDSDWVGCYGSSWVLFGGETIGPPWPAGIR